MAWWGGRLVIPGAAAEACGPCMCGRGVYEAGRIICAEAGRCEGKLANWGAGWLAGLLLVGRPGKAYFLSLYWYVAPTFERGRLG